MPELSQLSPDTPEELLVDLTIRSIEKAVQKARQQTLSTRKLVGQIGAMAASLGIDLSAVDTASEHAKNLDEAILRYIHYGEYTLPGLRAELRAAIPKAMITEETHG